MTACLDGRDQESIQLILRYFVERVGSEINRNQEVSYEILVLDETILW